jgi:tryptophan synthase alpha chain
MRATDLPVAVGCGVRPPEQAAAIARVADGVVVGSALVELVGEHGEAAPEYLRRLTSELAQAVHSQSSSRRGAERDAAIQGVAR